MQKDHAEYFLNIARKSLCFLASICYRSCTVPKLQDVLNSMKQRLTYEGQQIEKIQREMAELATAYNRFVDLKEELEKRQEAITKLAIAFDLQKSTHSANMEMTSVDDYALWQIVQLYVEFAGKAKVADIMQFLDWIKFKTTRQAVDSAIETHPKVFRIIKHGREKFISLK